MEPAGPSSRRTGLVISEIHYHPPDRADGRNLEFVELFNSKPIDEDLSGYRLSGDWDYTFPAGSVLAAGNYLVVAAAPGDVMAVYGVSQVFGGFTNQLPNRAGTVSLRNRRGALLLRVEYEDRAPWPAAADGTGCSLTLVRPSYGEDDPRGWEASEGVGGTPGAPNAVPTDPRWGVVINEFLANPATPGTGFVELYNRSTNEADIAGCWLSDDPATARFQIPAGAKLAAGGFLSFGTSQMGFEPDPVEPRLFLRNPDGTRVLDAVRSGGQSRGVTTGRFPDGSAVFRELEAATASGPNTRGLARGITLNELSYHPLSGEEAEEYVELYNRGGATVTLSGWSFAGTIEFSFPGGASVPPGGFVVVAKDPARVLANHPGLDPARVFGGFSGSLRRGRDHLELLMPEILVRPGPGGGTVTNLLDVVVETLDWAQGGRWGQWSDGGGSSLERIDPRSDPRLAPSWADSDESAKAPWTPIERSGVLDLGATAINEFHAMLLGRGECLLDNVEVSAAGGANLVGNATFESGAGGWLAQGNHIQSGLHSGGADSARSYLIRATSGGDNGVNRVETDLTTSLSTGLTATIRAQARWLRGRPNLLLRLHGNHLEASSSLMVPGNLGTPGQPNSRGLANAGPAFHDVTHRPAVPPALAPVVVEARIDDPDGISSATLRYRIDPQATLISVPLRDDGTAGDALAGDGIISATIPGQPSGRLVAFRLDANDGGTPPVPGRFPADAPGRECLVRFGEPVVTNRLGTYRFWMTEANVNAWEQRQKLSNEFLDGTLVYADCRIIYNAGARYHGSPYSRPGYNGPARGTCAFNLELPKDDSLLGADELYLDPPELYSNDPTLMREELAFYLADHFDIPFSHKRYMNCFFNGVPRGRICADAQQPNSDYVAAWFPEDDRGALFKIDDWFEFNDVVTFEYWTNATLQPFRTSGGVKKQARYRWNWEKKANHGLDDDYRPLFELVDALNEPDPQRYTARVESLVDVDEWMRAFAVRHISDDTDGYGHSRGKNMFAHKPANGRWQMIVMDLDHGFGTFSLSPGANIFAVDDPTIARLYAHPPFRRSYLQAFKEAVNGPFSAPRIDTMMNGLAAALTHNGITISNLPALKTWIDARRDYLRATVAGEDAVSFRITSNNGGDFSTNRNLALVSGTAPLEVRTVEVNGLAYPLSWADAVTWRMRVPLREGANVLVFAGLDRWRQAVSGSTRTITVTFTGTNDPPRDRVAINEILYHANVPGGEYVEVFNASPRTTFDLSGWSIEGIDWIFAPGTILEPGAFALLVAGRGVFQTNYPGFIPITGQFSGRLAPEGETLRLLQPALTPAAQVVIDEVTYDARPPWPSLANTGGVALQKIDPAQSGQRAGNWAAFPPTPPAQAQSYVSLTNGWRFDQSGADLNTAWRAPDFDDAGWGVGNALFYNETAQLPARTNTPLALGRTTYYFRTRFTNDLAHGPGGTLSLFTVVDDGAVFYLNGAEIFRTGMPTGTITAATFATRNVGDAVLEGPFPVPAAGIRIGENVFAAEVHQLTSFSPDVVFGAALTSGTLTGAPVTPGATNSGQRPLPPFPLVWFNELQPQNFSGPRDPAGAHEPWVELFNAGPATVDLTDFFLSDAFNNPTRWRFPQNATIGAGTFRLVWLDGEPSQSTLDDWHTSFRLPAAPGTLTLSARVDGSLVVLDHVAHTLVDPDRTLGLAQDGRPGTLRLLATPTPGSSNSPPADPLPIRINEWMAANRQTLPDPADGDDDDWLELFNPNVQAVDLSGHTLTDDLTEPRKFRLPPGTSLAGRGFLLIWADEEASQQTPGSEPHANFKLGQSGESIALFAPDGTLVDSVTFDTQTVDVSEGRFPDGAAGPFLSFPKATPRSPNVWPADRVRILVIALASDGITLVWAAQPGRSYRVEWQDALGAAEWTILPGDVTATETTASVNLIKPDVAQRFYRIRSQP